MKISNTNNLAANYSSLNLRTNGLSSSYSEKNNAKMFDAISIQSDPRQIAEKTFAASVAKTIASEVRVPASEDKVAQLKNQVASHAYQVDASAVAARMLLIKEDL